MNDVVPIPAGTDTKVASVARAYDYVLGGKDNFEVDRQFAGEILKRDPEVRVSAKLNKEFGRRVCQYMAEHGVKQFLDLGSGIPTSPPSVHETVRAISPEATVVYVDHDPVVAAHNRALRAVGTGLTAIQQDFSDPDAVLRHPEVQAHIDFSKPVGVLALSVFQNTLDDADVLRILDNIFTGMVSSSYLAVSHVSDRTGQEIQDQIAMATRKHGYPATLLRSDAQVKGLFANFDLVDPGVVDYRDWRPAKDQDRPNLGLQFVGGVGRSK